VTFPAGSRIERREVLHDRVWSVLPMTVVADTGDLLALFLAEDTPLSFPEHPFGPHPWSYTDRWRSSDVLHLHRPDDHYSVWAFHRSGERVGGWYVNFQRPLVRWAGGVDTLDHGLDIVVAADGSWVWKDREHVAEQVATGRLTGAEADEVWREAERVAALLDGDPAARWWESWSGWRPPG
jgi:Protein of unknown function (DUF402)